MTRKDISQPAPPTFTLHASDPIARNLLRFYIGAAQANGRIPAAQIEAAQAALAAFDRWQTMQRSKKR